MASSCRETWWVIITKDRHIKSNQIEIESLIRASAACCNIISAEMTGPAMASALLRAMGDIKRVLRKLDRPFVANVTRAGRVDVLLRYTDLVKRLP